MPAPLRSRREQSVQRGADHFRMHAEICKVLTDPKRLMLLDALRGGARSVGDLAATIGASLPNVSQHLGVLRAAGLVEGRRAGTTIFYELAEPEIVTACDVIDRIVGRRREQPFPPVAAGQPRASVSEVTR